MDVQWAIVYILLGIGLKLIWAKITGRPLGRQLKVSVPAAAVSSKKSKRQ